MPRRDPHLPRKMSFRTHMLSWMQSIDLELTPIRDLFLKRYEALLRLRGVSRYELGCRQAAMEVLLNLWRHPQRQTSYMVSMIRQLRKLIDEHLALGIPGAGTAHIHNWDVPGHVEGSGLRFSVIEDEAFGADGARVPPLILDMSH